MGFLKVKIEPFSTYLNQSWLNLQPPLNYGLEPLLLQTISQTVFPQKAFNYKTPLDTLSLHSKIPPTHSLPPRIFGCVVYVHLPKQNLTMLEPRAVKFVFVGYGVHQKGCRCFDPSQITCTLPWIVISMKTPTTITTLDVRGRNRPRTI